MKNKCKRLIYLDKYVSINGIISQSLINDKNYAKIVLKNPLVVRDSGVWL
jgi:hypothetical protein